MALRVFFDSHEHVWSVCDLDCNFFDTYGFVTMEEAEAHLVNGCPDLREVECDAIEIERFELEY